MMTTIGGDDEERLAGPDDGTRIVWAFLVCFFYCLAYNFTNMLLFLVLTTTVTTRNNHDNKQKP
jgi:hypothetical protein